MNRKKNWRRRLGIESLEKREVLTAYINELMFAPFNESAGRGQYIELRGEPDATIDPGTYLVVISDDNRFSSNPGAVTGIFDLSGQTWGSNGFLVLLPQASPYTLGAGLSDDGPGPTILRSTAPGFGGLPGDIYTNSIPGSDELSGIAGSASFFLIQSTVAPVLGLDIDADNNGTIDVGNAAQDWTVLDSISLHDDVFSGPVAYGQIAFITRLVSDEPAVLTPDNTNVIYTEGFGYAARIGDSTGHTQSDWVAGTVRSPVAGQSSPYYRFENGIFGVPDPYSFTGRELDHIGESNFFGGVRGTVTQTIVEPPAADQVVPIQGVTFLADTNDNGRRDVIEYLYDPDGFEVDDELTNVFPGVTLTTVNSSGENVGYEVQADLANTPGSINRVFSPLIFDFIPNEFRLRVDFARPVRSVAIDVIGRFNSIASVGRLEAFNAAGERLGLLNSAPLFGAGLQQTLRLSYSSDVIAYALAYTPTNSPAFASFDDLRFTQSEAIAVTDEDGEFVFRHLLPGDYDIVPLIDSDVALATPIPSTPITITRYEHFNLDFSTRLNSTPVIAAATFTLAENAAVDSLVGTVVATDLDLTQTLAFSIANESSSPFRIDAESGELFVKTPSALNFEANPFFTVPVTVVDSAGGTSTREIFVQLTDVNEPPQVTLDSYVVSEESITNEVFGRVNAFDPEFPDAPVKFVITGGSGANLFGIDESTGNLRVLDADLLDFESTPLLKLNVTVSDNATPPLTKSVTVNVALLNANDSPVITTESFNASEALLPGSRIGTVSFTDPDVGQSHTFRIVDDIEGLFAIDTTTGVLSLLGSLDFEANASHEVIVQVADNGTPVRGSSKTITINVSNVDEPATLEVTEFSLFEDAVDGSVIQTLAAFDPDGDIAARFKSVNAATPSKLFGGRVTLDQATGVLTVAAEADLDADGDEAVLEDRIVILDDEKVVGEVAVKLILANVNEAPTIPPQRFGLPTGIPSGRVFAQINFTDPENHDAEIEVVGDAAAFFGVDNDHRLFVLPGVTIDFQTTPEIKIDLEITDQLGLKSTSKSIVFQAPLPKFGTPIPPKTHVSGNELMLTLPAAFRSASIKSLALIAPDGGLPPGLRFDPLLARLSGLAAPSVRGTFEFIVQVLEQDGDSEILKQETLSLAINRSAKPLLNATTPLDVDGNSRIEPLDALRILNVLARNPGSTLAQELIDKTSFFVDPNGSNTVTSLDALLIINHLARQLQSSSNPAAAPALMSVNFEDRDNETKDAALTELLSDPELF